MVAFKLNLPQPAPPRPGARSPRRRVVISGRFQLLCGTRTVAIRNLSCTGALIACEEPLEVGQEGVLTGTGLDCLCRVIWRDGALHGLAFDQPIANAIVLEFHNITGADLAQAERAATREWFERQAR